MFGKRPTPSTLLTKATPPERVFDVVDIGRRNEFRHPIGIFDEWGRYHYLNPIQEVVVSIGEKVKEIVG